MKKYLDVSIITPKGNAYSAKFDDIVFITPDSANGKDGGSIAIHPGHISSLIALEAGEVKLYKDNALISSATVGSGFVTVSGSKLSIVTDKFEVKTMP